MRTTVRLLGIISVLILARLLAPADFGLIAKVMLVSGFLDLCSQFGFDNALIKNQKADDRDYDTVWTLSIIRGLTMAAILIVFSAQFSHFFEHPQLTLVFCVYGVANALSGFINVGVVNFRKEMQFHLDFKFNLLLKVSSFITTVTIALIWQSYWALPLGILVREIIAVASSYWLSPYRPRLSLSRWESLFSFSKWMIGFNLMAAISQKVDTFILSRMTDAKELGLYTVGYEIAGTPSAEIAMPVARAALPGLSKLNQKPKEFQAMYVEIISNVLLIAIPAGVGLSLLAQPITLLVLGPQWEDAAVFIEVLALFGITRVISATSVSALIAFGLVDKLAKISVANLIVRLICLPLGYYWGAGVGMTLGVLASGLFTMLVYLAVQQRNGMLSIAILLQKTWRILVSSTLMYCLLAVIIVPSISSFSLPMMVGLAVVCGALSFSLSVISLWLISGKPQGTEQNILSWLSRKIHRH